MLTMSFDFVGVWKGQLAYCPPPLHFYAIGDLHAEETANEVDNIPSYVSSDILPDHTFSY